MIKLFVAILSILLVLLVIDIPAAQAYGGGYYDFGGADAYCRYEVNCRNYCPREQFYYRPYQYTCPRASCCRGCRQMCHHRDGCIYSRPMPGCRRHGFGPGWEHRGGFGRYHRYYRPSRPGRCR